jgi:HEAT repeat protein
MKFSQQLFEELSTHLNQYAKLTFLVQRSALMCKDQVVYQPENEGGSESIAFKLYADGIRELVLHQGLAQDDLGFFLDSLWGGTDPTKDDDDIVTRLWSKNLTTLTLVTAEEVAKASGGNDGFLVLDGGMSTSDSSLRELLDREQVRGKSYAGKTDGSGAGSDATSAAEARRRFKSNLIGYEVTAEELAALAKEIGEECQRDGTLYVLDMASAILASEKSPALLSKLLGLWGHVLNDLLRDGRWTVIESVLGLLHEVEAIRPDLGDEHKRQLASLFDGLGQPDRMKAIESYLNRTPHARTEGLSTILLLMKPDAIPALCSLLAGLESPVHQAIVSDVLLALAKGQPDALIRGLSDRRPAYVRNLLAILIKWNNPRFAEPVEKLTRYPDANVRKEVIRAISVFRPNGNGMKLIAFVTDSDEAVRLAALKLLMTGQYTASFSHWAPLLASEEFMDRPLSERRAVYQAVRATSGDEAIPHWQQLLTEWHWSNRKKKEELAVLAAETLGKLGTPAAIATLELGQKKGGGAIRQACAMALSHIQKQQRGKPPMAAAS